MSTKEIIEQLREGRPLPFLEFPLDNGMILRFLREDGKYICRMGFEEAITYLDPDWVDPDDEHICPACSGSGEGRHDGESCYKCKGTGEEPAERKDDEY